MSRVIDEMSTKEIVDYIKDVRFKEFLMFAIREDEDKFIIANSQFDDINDLMSMVRIGVEAVVEEGRLENE